MKPIRVGVLNIEPLLQSKLPLLLVFGAIWNRGSNSLFSTLESLGEKYDGLLLIGMVDIDYASDIFHDFEVLELPTLIFCEGGKPTMRQEGYSGTYDVDKFIRKCFGVPPLV